jgi:UDP-N-acetyl-D-mannosaminuronate dehydrogenase
MKNKTLCILGSGYAGLPLANAFSKHLKVIGGIYKRKGIMKDERVLEKRG